MNDQTINASVIGSLPEGNPVNITRLSTDGTSVTLTLQDFSADAYEKIELLAWHPTTHIEVPLSFEQKNASEITVDMAPMSTPEILNRRTFYFFLIATQDQQRNSHLLKIDTLPRTVIAENLWYQKENGVQPEEYMVFLYPDEGHQLASMFCLRSYYLNLTMTCKLKRISMHGKTLKISYILDPDIYEYTKTYLEFRHVLPQDAKTADFQALKCVRRGNLLHITVSFDMSTIEWQSIYWDIRVQLRLPSDGKLCTTSIAMDTAARMYNKFLYNGYYPGKDGFFLYPYYTGAKTLALVYRERVKYDGLDIVFKELTAVLLYKLSKPYWKKQHIALVCEKYSEQAQESGYCFFKHCMDENEEKNLGRKIYYIITKDSPDRHKLEPYSNRVIDFMSIRHMIYTQAAELIISSDSRYHSYAFKSRHSIFNRYLKKVSSVFLQHGVISFKRVPSFTKGMKLGCDLFVVSTDRERQIVIDNLGYDPEQVINTGLPRWDVLEDKSQGSREVLIMPTWRYSMEIISDNDFEQSLYFRSYMALLNSPRFADILEKYDLQVNFYLHPKFQNHMGTFRSANDRVHLLTFGDIPVNEMLMRCRMLITDYSSVSWDVFYQDKPVIFYQFDLDTYEEAEGSYIDMHTELFGDRAETADDLLNLFEKQIQNDFKMYPQYEKMRHEYFTTIDRNHSKRVCECIKNYFK